MPEKFESPYMEHAVGIPPGKEREFEEAVAKQIERMGGKLENELEKTEQDIMIINFADNAVQEYLKKYGKNKETILPLNNIHLLPEGGVEKFTNSRVSQGVYAPKLHDMLLDRPKNDMQFALYAFHELLHAKSYRAVQITTERKFQEYRNGFNVVSRDGRVTYFNDVEEAIVGYMERRFYREKLLQSELFKDEISAMRERNKDPEFSRHQEMQSGIKLVEALYEKNKKKFESVDEIVDLFVEAQATGNLLKVGRLIESTFGKGSFRKLGEKTARKLPE